MPYYNKLGKGTQEKARTLKRGSESGSISDENVQAAKVCHGGGDSFLRLLDVAHVGWEGEHLCGGSLAQDGVSACIQRLLLACDDCQGRASTRELQGRLETDPA